MKKFIAAVLTVTVLVALPLASLQGKEIPPVVVRRLEEEE